MKLYSYIITHDTGFSPNPFGGYCTLANCKPVIRRTAQIKDWVIGISSAARGHKLIYAMEINEILTYAYYFADKRFHDKLPTQDSQERIRRRGDNIYKPDSANGFIQLKNNSHDHRHFDHDLKGKYVLISINFVYLGINGIDLPENLLQLTAGRGHKCKFDNKTIDLFRDFIHTQPRGVIARPSMNWPADDDSWKK